MNDSSSIKNSTAVLFFEFRNRSMPRKQKLIVGIAFLGVAVAAILFASWLEGRFLTI